MGKKIEIPKEFLADFCRRYRILRLSLFGSALREDFGPDSDVDILVEFEAGAKVGLNFFAMEIELTEILGRKVDLNTPGFISRYFRERVLKEAVVQYEQV
ncbi:MAG: nucleotidyltransferase family protein [Thermodesulfobacteriota bacterium]